MTSKRLMLPLLYKSVTTLKGPTWYLDSNVNVENIYDEDFGAIFRDTPENYRRTVTANTKCIYINEPVFKELALFSKSMATRLKFLLNNYSTGTPVVFPFAILSSSSGKTRKVEVVDLDTAFNLRLIQSQSYKVKPKVGRATISDYYKVLSRVCDQNTSILFTLERFNSSLARVDPLDQIVDLAISLESLISGNQELRFRFALYHSFIAESNAQERKGAFNLLLALYDARSGIVHGDTKSKSVEKLQKAWSEILRLARASLNYYLLFVYEHDKKEWDEHLRDLVFGLVPRIV